MSVGGQRPLRLLLPGAIAIEQSERHLNLPGTRVGQSKTRLGSNSIDKDPGLRRQRGRGHCSFRDQLPVRFELENRGAGRGHLSGVGIDDCVSDRNRLRCRISELNTTDAGGWQEVGKTGNVL